MPTVPARERRLVAVIGAVVFVDTVFYAVLAPLLPALAHQLHLSKLSAGALTASYAMGSLLGSIPCGILAARAGPRPTVVSGLALLSLSTIAFAFLHNVVLLDLARLLEGIGGACSWAGGMAWIAAETAPERRGALIGRALGAAIGGALFGPVIGTLANLTSRPVAFSLIVVVALALIAASRRLPTSHESSPQGLSHLRTALRDRPVQLAMWLVTLPAAGSGLLNVLGPLRLHRFGADAIAVGATFLVAAGIEAVVSPVLGGVSDRRGRLLPLRVGLAGTSVMLICFALPRTAVLLAAVIVACAAMLGAFWAPAMAMLSDAADSHGLDQGLAAALTNLAWATGQVLGSAGGGAVAKVTGDVTPTVIAAVACLTSLIVLRRARTGMPALAGASAAPVTAAPSSSSSSAG
jgi:MFS family permease